MKSLIVAVFSVVALCAIADETAAPKVKMTPEQAKAKREELMMKAFGGLVTRENSAKGKISFINTQKKVSTSEIVGIVEKMKEDYRYTFEVIDGKPEDAEISAAKPIYGNLRVFVTSKPGMPSLVIVPESHWGVVNVDALEKDKPNEKILAKRVRAEVVRAFGMLAGGSDSVNLKSLFAPILMPSDLDGAAYDLVPPDVDGHFDAHLKVLGIQGYERTTYQRACQLGWAPQPTNEYQKAIWDKVYSVPEKPIKIQKKK